MSIKQSDLDYLIETPTNDDTQIENPFFVSLEGGDVMKLEMKAITSTYDRVLLLCLKTLNPGCDVDALVNPKTTINTLKSFAGKLALLPAPTKILYNFNHLKHTKIVDQQFLECFDTKMTFKPKELVITVINLAEKDLKRYVGLYETHDIHDWFKTKLICDFFNCSNYKQLIRTNMKALCYNNKETDYWTNYYNCLLNMTMFFIDRRLEYKMILNKKIKAEAISVAQKKPETKEQEQINSIIDNLMKTPPDKQSNYLEFINRKNVFVDASLAIKHKGYKMYRLNKNKSEFSFEEVNEWFNNLTEERDLYDVFNTFLLSKNNCHLVLNNATVLKKMSPIINKYLPVYKYLFGYAWMVFYLEECIMKTRSMSDSRYVMDLDTACELPYFPSCANDPHMNPYSTVLVSKDVLNGAKNYLGLMTISAYKNYGLNNLDGFLRNFNLFTTGRADKNIFTGLKWDNVAVTGSVMSACTQKENPLMMLFNSLYPTADEARLRYFREYYGESDVDVMVYKKSIFDFIDKVYEISDTVKKNQIDIHGPDGAEVKVVAHKTLVILVSVAYIKEKMKDFTVEHVINNMQTNAIRELFYKLYFDLKFANNNLERKEKKDEKYESHYQIVPINDMVIIFTGDFIDSKTHFDHDNEYYIRRNDTVTPANMEDSVFDAEKMKENPILLKISEGLKFKVESPKLLHKLEIFKIKFEEFLSTVARFHLPCVRAYVSFKDGKYYMKCLPSFISAMMTGMNVDYKYFAGTKDPIEIVNKYRMRTFGTYVNDVERTHILEYSRQVVKWNNFYGIDLKDKTSVEAVFGGLTLSSKLFQQGRYKGAGAVDEGYDLQKVTGLSYIVTEKDLYREYMKICGYYYKTVPMNLLKFKTINEMGYIQPVKRFILEEGYDQIRQMVKDYKDLPPLLESKKKDVPVVGVQMVAGGTIGKLV